MINKLGTDELPQTGAPWLTHEVPGLLISNVQKYWISKANMMSRVYSRKLIAEVFVHDGRENSTIMSLDRTNNA